MKLGFATSLIIFFTAFPSFSSDEERIVSRRILENGWSIKEEIPEQKVTLTHMGGSVNYINKIKIYHLNNMPCINIVADESFSEYVGQEGINHYYYSTSYMPKKYTFNTYIKISNLILILEKNDLVPLNIIDRIILALGPENFLWDIDALLTKIKEQRNEEKYDEKFLRITIQELNKIKSPIRRQCISWQIAQKLFSKCEVPLSMLIYLYNLIDCKDLPFFAEANELGAELNYILEGDLSHTERYRPIITCMLQQDNPDLKTWLRYFMGGFGSIISEKILNIKFNEESMFELLNIIYEKEQTIKKQQNTIEEYEKLK